MKIDEFRRRIAGSNKDITSPTVKALQRILVNGDIAYRVCRELKISQSQISRARKLIMQAEPLQNCPKCGQSIR